MMEKRTRIVCLILGPGLFFACLFLLPENIFTTMEARGAIGTISWMAFWWITGPVDFAITGFLPIVVNALFQITDMSLVISNYADEIILLLLGASLITVSWEKTGLDKRIAAKFLSLIGNSMRSQIAFWFLLTTILSSVLPNAVVCAAITPIAVSMLKYVGIDDIGKSLNGSLILLTIAYGAGIGGLASPLGGAMNLVAVEYLQQVTGEEFMYIAWVVRFLPLVIVLAASNIIYLMLCCKKGDSLGGSKEYFIREYKSMPKISKEESWALGLFLTATVLSFSRQLYQDILPGLKPAYVFIICAALCFIVQQPDGNRLITWKFAQSRVVWDLLYIFAGGLAAGTLINESGAAGCIGTAMANANLDGGFLTVLVIVTITIIMSDITSNTATAAVALPIVISIVEGIGLNPIPYIYIAVIGVNISYMLPTSIRAIPVGYGLEPKFMLKRGAPLTVIVILLMSVIGYLMLAYWPMFSTT